MATVLTKAIISSATDAVDTYITTANTIASDLNTIISSLTAENFKGDASDGYSVFYNEKIVPAVTENLTGTASLMSSIKNILEAIQTQLLDTLDPQLGEYNRNPGSEA